MEQPLDIPDMDVIGMIINPSFKERQIYAAGQKKTKYQVKYLKGVLSVELTDITAKNVRAPDDREVLRRHPGPLRVQGHLVQVPHQEVDCPGIMGIIDLSIYHHRHDNRQLVMILGLTCNGRLEACEGSPETSPLVCPRPACLLAP